MEFVIFRQFKKLKLFIRFHDFSHSSLLQSETFYQEQFRAILKQDYPGEWEIIISDDFSQDGSFECLEEMVEKEGEGRRIILHRNESNRGIAGNLQCAVHLSRGEWIIKFDGDDIAREDRISSLASLAEQYPGHLVYCHSYNEIDEDGQPAYGRMLPDSDSVVVKPYRECIFDISHVYSCFGGNAMYHRSLFSDFEYLPSGPGIADDTMLSMRAYLKNQAWSHPANGVRTIGDTTVISAILRAGTPGQS